MQTRKEQTYDRNLEKLNNKTQKSLKKLKAIEFACEPDAKQAAEQWITANPGYIFQVFSISTSSRKASANRGRPKIEENSERFTQSLPVLSETKSLFGLKKKNLAGLFSRPMTVPSIRSVYSISTNSRSTSKECFGS